MAQEDRTFRTSTPAANRAETQGLGVGQREMDAQRSPSREQHATDPRRTEPFDQSLEATSGDDLGGGSSDMGAGAVSRGPGDGAQPRGQAPREDREATADEPVRRDPRGLDPDQSRNEADIDDAGDLGAGTPANVDVHKLGQGDNPEEDWGDEIEEGLLHSANHSRRGVKTEAERGQGAKTRRLNKDIVSRRA